MPLVSITRCAALAGLRAPPFVLRANLPVALKPDDVFDPAVLPAADLRMVPA